MPRNIRPIRVEGNIAFVPLTQGYEAVIDAGDVPLVAGRNWYAMVARRSDGSIRAVYAHTHIRRDDGKQAGIYLHRVIADTPDGMDTDHRDGDGLNNRRENLREATRSQNMRNQRLSTKNSSGFKGVTWNKKDKKWQAQIMVGGTPKHLGYHATAEAAHAAYCEASSRLHGEFGKVA